MADFRLNVTADTDEASRKVGKLDSDVTNATKPRSIKIDIPNLAEINKGITDIDRNIKTAANTIKQFGKFADFVPGIGSTKQLASNIQATAKAANEAGINVSSAGKTLSSSMEVAARSTSVLTDRLLSVGASVYLVQAAVGALKGAFAGFFNETIGREIKLRETILKTQTTLASTNKVFRNGKEVTDPYQKIVSLTGEISKHIDSIRERSIALAGVTSNDVIEVFGLVAQQVGQIGGGLKEAEDLAISFAGALGTFNIPLYQARQEIGSILRGDITTDSYLAKSLGITNEDIAKAKTQVGGVTKFLEDRLAAAVAGQRIAAEGFSGVVSNLKDLQELVSQQFGAGLLDPLLDGLTKIFTFLFSIKTELFAIASTAGKIVGSGIATVFGQVQGRSKLAQGTEGGTQQALTGAKKELTGVATTIQSAMSPVIGQLTTLLERAAIGIAVIVKGLGDLAKGFLSLQLTNLQAAIGVLETLSRTLLGMAGALSGVLSAWGSLLKEPIVQEFSRIQTIFGVITKTGLPDMVGKILLVIGAFRSWQTIVPIIITQINLLRTIIGSIVLTIGKVITSFASLGQAMANAAAKGSAAVKALGVEIGLLSKETAILGQTVQRSGDKLGGLGQGIEKAKGGLTGLAINLIKTNLMMLAAQVIISALINAYSKWKERQDEIASDRRAEVAFKRLSTTYKNLGEDATAAQKRARDFEQALVDAQYNKAISKLEEVREKINQLRYELKPGIQSWREFWDAISGSEAGRFEQGNREAIQKLLADEGKTKATLNQYEREKDKQSAAENIKLEAQKRTDLSKEIADLERGHASKLFELRQQAASKEVEIFRLAGELRIAEVERANAKMLKGQEGASAVAIEALNKYLATRERGELEIEAAKQELHIESANLDKSVADYRIAIEKQIAEIKKKSNENDIATADYRKQQLLAGGATGAAGSNDSISAAVTATKNLTGVNNQCAEAVKRFMAVIGVNSSVMDLSAKSAEKMGTVMTDWSKLQPGDIVARGSKGDPNHVGVYTGGQNVFHQSAGRGLTAGNYPDLGYFKEKGYFIRPSGMAAGAGPVAKPVLQETPSFKDPKAYGNDVAAITGNIKNLNARVADLRAQATNANTKAAFDAILDGLFPEVPIEGAQNDLIERFNKINAMLLNTGVDTSASAAEQKFADIKADTLSQIEILKREKNQFLAVIAERRNSSDPNNKLSDKEADRITNQTEKRLDAQITKLKEVEKVKKSVAAAENYQETLTQQQQLLIQFNQQTEAIKEEADARRLANRLRMEGFSEEQIQNELRKLKLDQDFAKSAAVLDAQYLILQNSLAQYNLEQAKGTVLTGAAKQAYDDLVKKLDELKRKRDELEGKKDKAKTDGDAATKGAKETPRDALTKRAGDLKKELNELTKWSNIVAGAAESIGSAFSASFKGVIDGSMTTREALASFFKSIASYFMDMAAKIIAKMIEMAIINTIVGLLPGASGGGGGGGFDTSAFDKFGLGTFNPENSFILKGKLASGGPVSAGSTYLVGEEGPELFRPTNSGTIIPNNQLGGGAGVGGSPMNIVVNVDAKGTQVSGNDDKGAALGRVVSQAVQAELVKQQRPGGLLAGVSR